MGTSFHLNSIEIKMVTNHLLKKNTQKCTANSVLRNKFSLIRKTTKRSNKDNKMLKIQN